MSDAPEPPDPTLPVESAVAADQVAAHATEGHGHHGPFHTHCENCGTKLEGPYCHKCGQHDFEFHRSFWHVFLEGLESFLHFDSKLFHTVATLIFRPGRLTAAFNAGKRTAQMPPLRLYIFVSLVFFFLFFLDHRSPDRLFERDLALTGQVVETGEAEQAKETPAPVIAGAPAAPGENAARPPEETERTPFVQWLEAQGRRAADPEHQREMVEKFMHALPKMLLLCLPFFALYTRLLFRKAGLVYLQHLVLALHFHTLILLWSMLKDGWVFLADLASPSAAGLLKGVFNLWLCVYPFLMFRHLFPGSWAKTILKTGLLVSLYTCTLLFASLVGGFIIFAML